MKPLLKKVGGFLINLILTNKRETVAGSTINEVETTSSLFGLNLNDLFKGLVMSVLGAVVGDLYAMLQSGSFVIDWQAIKHGAIVAAVAYIMKQFGTPSQKILKLLIIGLLFSLPLFGQNNATVKALQSWNADSTTVRALANLDSIMGRETGWLYFNNVTRKWRLGIATPDSVKWYDIGTGSTVTADNGLTKTGNNIQLGGPLTQTTSITGGQEFSIETTGANPIRIESLNDETLLFGGSFISVLSNISAELNGSGNVITLDDTNGVNVTPDINESFTVTTTGASIFSLSSGSTNISGNSSLGNVVITAGGGSDNDVEIGATDQVQILNLAGVGTRMVTADVNGNLGSTAIPAATAPAGSNTQIQWNNAGSFGADSGLTYTNVTNTQSLSVGSGASGQTGFFQVSGNNGVNASVLGITSNGSTNSIELSGGGSVFTSNAGADITFENSSTNVGSDVHINAAGGNINIVNTQSASSGEININTDGGQVNITGENGVDIDGNNGVTIDANVGDVDINAVGDVNINGNPVGVSLWNDYVIDFGNTVSLGGDVGASPYTFTGAAVGDDCIVTMPFSPIFGICTCYVNAADQVTLAYRNVTSAPVDLGSGTYSVRIFKH